MESGWLPSRRAPDLDETLRLTHGLHPSLSRCGVSSDKGDPPKSSCPPKDVFRWEWVGNDLHPAQKPVMVIKPLIQSFSKRGDIILDPFAGSGTTGIAARECGRKFILLEKVWDYYRVAERRLRGQFDTAVERKR